MTDPDSGFRELMLKRMNEVERALAVALWAAQDSEQAAEDAIAAHYWPALKACAKKEDAERLLSRVPDCVSRVFFLDYVRQTFQAGVPTGGAAT